MGCCVLKDMHRTVNSKELAWKVSVLSSRGQLRDPGSHGSSGSRRRECILLATKASHHHSAVIGTWPNEETRENRTMFASNHSCMIHGVRRMIPRNSQYGSLLLMRSYAPMHHDGTADMGLVLEKTLVYETGAFQKLPMVAPAKETIDSAVRKSSRLGANNKLKNEAAKARNQAARQLDSLMKEIVGPLRNYERGFPHPSELHPFERALMDLTVGSSKYESALARVIALRKAAVEVAKGFATRASKAANKREALSLRDEGYERITAVYDRGSAAVEELKEIAKSLRRLPVVDPDLPTVALVGAPNVGKSSLVQLLSSGLPEIQNYPFTTRNIKMGHFYVKGRRHQVTDTPGLLNRLDEDRNAMERLTLASLEHLPTAVLFVADLTEECGTSVKDQWAIRCELKRKFPDKPWIDVISKSDLLEEELDEVDEILKLQENATVPNVQKCMDYAMAVPDALRISSITGAGIDNLKMDMLKMIDRFYSLQQKDETIEGDRVDTNNIESLDLMDDEENPDTYTEDSEYASDSDHEVVELPTSRRKKW